MDLLKLKEDIGKMVVLPLKLFNLEYLNENGTNYLRVTIDSDTDIDIDDIEALSNVINEYLDKTDPIDEEYVLEVTSRGIEREFSFDEAKDYLKEYILVKTYDQVQYGYLVKADNSSISIKNNRNKIINIDANDIVLLRTAVKF